MANSSASEIERMTITRVFDAPRELVWKAWTDPQYVMQWWGPKGFTSPVCKMDFRVGGKFLCCMRSPDGHHLSCIAETFILNFFRIAFTRIEELEHE